MNNIELKKGVIAEIQRIAKKFSNTITLSQYNKHCKFDYRWELVKYRLKLRWNDLKADAGISASTRSISKSHPLRRPKITRRNCNMRDTYHGGKDFWFDAKDNYYSCPSCTNIKNGEAYTMGLDEFSLKGYV
jgi:hypothetical protein